MKKIVKIMLSFALVLGMMVSFASCVPKTGAKAKEKLEDKGYTVVLTLSSDTLGAATNGVAAKLYGLDANAIEEMVVATNGDDSVTIYYCKDSASAKTLYGKLKDAKEDAIEDAKEESDSEALEAAKNTKVGKSGKVVYAGTKAGVKAAN